MLYSEFYAFKKEKAQVDGKKLDPVFWDAFGKYGDKAWIKYIKLGSVFVELFDAGSVTEHLIPDDKFLNYQHLSLLVDDIHKFTEKIRKAGVPIDDEPAVGMEHTWQMWSHDPDGNKIEFMQYTDKSYQVVGKPVSEYI